MSDKYIPSGKGGHFLTLTGCDKTVISLKVTGKAELVEACELFSKLSKIANKALKGCKTPSAFFSRLEFPLSLVDWNTKLNTSMNSLNSSMFRQLR